MTNETKTIGVFTITLGIFIFALGLFVSMISAVEARADEAKLYVIGKKVEGTTSQFVVKKASYKNENALIYDCKQKRMGRKGTLQNKPGAKSIYILGKVSGTDSKFDAEKAFYESENATVFECNRKVLDKKTGKLINW